MRMNVCSRNWLALTAAITLCAWGMAIGAEKTAFDLVKEGNRYVGEQSRNKIAQLHSDKSIGGTEPNVWYVVYYDPLAKNKSVEVKFGAGQMMGVRKWGRFFDFVGGSAKPIDLEELKIDSTEALKIVMDQPLLKNIKVSASKLKLQRKDDFEEPVWQVSLWAPKLRDNTKDAEVAETTVGAKTGKILETDIRLNRLD